jgi:hypothetical protein
LAAPDYVPVSHYDRPRDSLAMPPPTPWTSDRPGDLQRGQPLGPRLGRPGPDQGYAVKLAHDLEDRLHLIEGEDLEDVVDGAVAIALRRASMYGRAPVIHDLQLAFGLFGFLDEDPPADLAEERRALFAGAGHHYWEQRALVDMIPEETLRMTPADVRSRLAEWRTLAGVTD